MKRFMVAAAAVLFTAGALQAQRAGNDNADQANHFQHKGFHRDGMRKLNLSDDQKAKMKTLRREYGKQFADLKNNNSMTVGDFKNKTAALRKEQHEKMQQLLTPEQRTQLAAQSKEGMHGRGMKGGRGKKDNKEAQAKHLDRMKTQLGLTDEQAQKIKDNQAGFREKIKTIRQDQTLTADQKKEQVKALGKEQREKMKSVLTPEQLDKMKSNMKTRGMSSR